VKALKAAGLVVFALALTGCSPVQPKGWTRQTKCTAQVCDDIGARPNDGRWLGFRLGMSQQDAFGALCEGVLKGEIIDADYLLYIKNGQCFARPKTAPDSWDEWFVKAPGFWCFLPPGRQIISFDFSNKGRRLGAISAWCPPFDF
jgi:hypothetical protein